jgi:hypothetical protein
LSCCLFQERNCVLLKEESSQERSFFSSDLEEFITGGTSMVSRQDIDVNVSRELLHPEVIA